MGPFILGVLVGWLAEWMFYTFWVKAGKEDGDCSSLKAELKQKNKQISSLQSQLTSISEVSSDNSKSIASVKTDSKAKPAESTAKKAIPKKADTKTASSKTTANKAESKPTTSKNSSATQKKNSSGDDFTKLTGIGPSMSATLKGLGIDTFDKLAATDDDKLREMLEESGAKMNNNKEAMDSWNEQATVAAKGDFKALKEMQAALKK